MLVFYYRMLSSLRLLQLPRDRVNRSSYVHKFVNIVTDWLSMDGMPARTWETYQISSPGMIVVCV